MTILLDFINRTLLTPLHRLRRSDSDNSDNEEESERQKIRGAFYAIYLGNVDEVRKLLNAGLSVNAVEASEKDNTLLHYAVERGKREIVELLLFRGAKINAKNKQNNTPLHLAVKKAIRRRNAAIEKDIISTLIAGRADTTAQNNDGKTPFDLALGHPELLNRLGPLPAGPKRRLGTALSTPPVKIPKIELEEHKTSGGLKNSLHGDIYQLKLLMLFLLRGVKNNYQFKLATEHEGVGAFDDVYFEYKSFVEEKFSSLQAKSKQNAQDKITYSALYPPNKSDKAGGPFALQRYFLAYLEARCYAKDSKKKLEYLIICTNAGLQAELLRPPKTDLQIQFEKTSGKTLLGTILTTESNQEFYQIAKDTTIKNGIKKLLEIQPSDKSSGKLNDLIQKLGVPRAGLARTQFLEQAKEEFINKLIFAVNQPDEHQLGEQIKTELGDELKLPQSTTLSDLDLAYGHFQEAMLNWFKAKVGTYQTNESGRILFKTLGNKVAKLIGLGFTAQYCAKFREFEVTQSSVNALRLSEFLDSSDSVLSVNSQFHILSALKIYQSLQTIKQDDQYLMIRLNTLLQGKETLLAAFEAHGSELLIIDCKPPKQNEVEAIQLLLPELKQLIMQSNKKIVLIAQDSLAQYFASLQVRHIKDETRFEDLTQGSQAKLLSQTIKFQGKLITVQDLLGTETNLIDASFLEQLINAPNEINVGPEVISLGEADDYYIQRKFNYQVAIKREIQAAETSGKFKDLLRYSEETFKQSCQDYPSRRIHWLMDDWGQLTWQQSQGSLSELSQYLEKDQGQKYSEADLREYARKTVIISDTAGMGKSTLLIHLAEQIKIAMPEFWVVRFNLNDHTQSFRKRLEARGSRFGNPDLAVAFLAELLPLKTSLESELFKQSLFQTGKIILLFDGFDEISPDYKDIVIELLQSLKNTQVKNLYITTRSYTRTFLEDRLSVFSHTLVPLSEAEQSTFLVQFWQQRNPDLTDSERIKNYAARLIQKLSTSISDQERALTGIPLQLRMVAEIFEQKQDAFNEEGLKEFYLTQKEEPNFPEKLNLLDLYRSFLKKKYAIYCLEKQKKETSIPAVRTEMDALYSLFIEGHIKLALYTLLHEETLKKLASDHDVANIKSFTSAFIDTVKAGQEKTGIVDQIIEDKPHFIHQTFAEYFVSDFLIEQLVKNNPSQAIQTCLFTDILIRSNYQGVRSFLNSQLISKPLMDSTLAQFGVTLADLEQKGELRDQKERATVLHRAAVENNVAIFTFLLNSLKTHPDTLQALKAQRPNPIQALLCAQDEYGRTPLHVAIKMGHSELLVFLLAVLKDYPVLLEELLFAKDRPGNTPLHDAGSSDRVTGILLEAVKYNPGLRNKLLFAEDGRGDTPLHKMTKPEAIRLLLGVVKDQPDLLERLLLATAHDGATPLFRAVFSGRLTAIHVLLAAAKTQSGLLEKMLARSANDWTPLQRAVFADNLETIGLLLEAAKDQPGLLEKVLLAERPNGWTPFQGVIFDNLRAIGLLLEAAKNQPGLLKKIISARNENDWTPLHEAVYWNDLAAIDALLGVVKDQTVLLGEVLLARNNDAWTPLHRAAYYDNSAAIAALLEAAKGATKDQPDLLKTMLLAHDKSGCTPLYRAVATNKREAVSALLAAVEDRSVLEKVLLAHNEDGWTPLYRASFDDPEAVGLLLRAAAKAQPDLLTQVLFAPNRNKDKNRNDTVLTLYGFVFDSNLEAIAPLLAVAHDRPELLKKILLLRNEQGWTLLHEAVFKENLAAIDALLAAVKNQAGLLEELLAIKSESGWTPLHQTAFNENSATIGFLLAAVHEVKGKPNLLRELLLAQNNHGWTLLHRAVVADNVAVIRVVLEAVRGDPQLRQDLFNAENQAHQTPLLLSVNTQPLDDALAAAALLLDQGALNTLNAEQNEKIKEFKLHQRMGPQRVLQDMSFLMECIPQQRKKRSPDACLFNWEDIDKFNVEQKASRDPKSIQIDSESFIRLLQNMRKTKQAQLIQFADRVPVIGPAQASVKKLIRYQGIQKHLQKVGRVSSVVMHGMIVKTTLEDFLQGDTSGVAINLGFIAGGQGFAKIAEASTLRGTELIVEGKHWLGQSFKAASPFLARSTSAFVAFDLAKQIKAFRNGTAEAQVGIVGDSIYLGVDITEIGIEVAEGFELLEGVSSVTGPIGAAIGAVVFVGTDIYLAVKRVEKIDNVIHLTSGEKFIEGVRAFLGMQLGDDITHLMEEKQLSNQLVQQALAYLKQQDHIQRYVFPTGKSVIDACRTVYYQASVCNSARIGSSCAGSRTETRRTWDCTHKFQPDLNNRVFLREKRSDLRESLTQPDQPDGGELFCLPQGEQDVAPNPAYRCDYALGVLDLTPKAGNITLISSGEGDDTVEGLLDGPNIVVTRDGQKRLDGGNHDDLFILQGECIYGSINGGQGSNTLELGDYAPTQPLVVVHLDLDSKYLVHSGGIHLSINKLQKLFMRQGKWDRIGCGCDTQFVDGRGGADHTHPDNISIPARLCFYQLHIAIRPNTKITNHATRGNFTYGVTTGTGVAHIHIQPTGQETWHRIFFNMDLRDVAKIETNYLDEGHHISFSLTTNKTASNPEDRFFNVTIDAQTTQTTYQFADQTTLKLGKKNLYAIQASRQSVPDIIHCYPDLAHKLQLSIFARSLLTNETVIIGHGHHDVLYSDPEEKSHLIGSDGENIYVIAVPDTTEKNFRLPTVTLYRFNTQPSVIDTLDLRGVVRRIEAHTPVNTMLQRYQSDLQLMLFAKNHLYLTVILKNASLEYEQWHVISRQAPQNIQCKDARCNLTPAPLVFDHEKKIMMIQPDDVEPRTELRIEQRGEHLSFVREDDDLILTNAFYAQVDTSELWTLTLHRFYLEAKMHTLTLIFFDRTLVLADEQLHLEQVPLLTEQMNHTRFTVEDAMNDLRVSAGMTQKTETHYLQSILAAGGGLLALIGAGLIWKRAPLLGVLMATQWTAIPPAELASLPKKTDKVSIPAIENVNSIHTRSARNVATQSMDFNGTLLLSQLLARTITKSKRGVSFKEYALSDLEVHAYALNIAEEFKNHIARKLGLSVINLDLDPIALRLLSKLVKHIRQGDDFKKISETLHSAEKEACSEREKPGPLALVSNYLEKIMLAPAEKQNLTGTSQVSVGHQMKPLPWFFGAFYKIGNALRIDDVSAMTNSSIAHHL